MSIGKPPPGAEVVRTYCDLDKHVAAFFEGRYQLLVVIGAPGLSKSTHFEKRIGPTSHLIKGWTAPLQAYMDCYLHRNKLLVFDDAESLWQKPAGRILLRSLTEHTARKQLQWASTVRALEKANVPQHFSTTSRVAIIANQFVFGRAFELEAVSDRAQIIVFDPLAAEVHQRVGDWYWDQEIYDYVGQRLHLIDRLSARVYTKASERRAAQGDWRRLIDEVYCHETKSSLVQRLERDPACPTVESRVAKFIELTGASRATYFNLKRELNHDQQLHALDRVNLPRRSVKGTPPPTPNIEEEVSEAQEEDALRRARGPADNGDQGLAGPADPADAWKHPQPELPKSKRPPDPPPDEDLAAWLQRELEAAVCREDYDRAATLRDQLRRMKENGDQQNG